MGDRKIFRGSMGQYQLQAVIRTFTPRFGSYRFGIQDHPVAVATAIKVLGLFHPIGLLPSHALPIPLHVDSDWKPAMGRKPEKLFSSQYEQAGGGRGEKYEEAKRLLSSVQNFCGKMLQS